MTNEPRQRIYADVGAVQGEGNNATQYLLFRKLTQQVPHHIYNLMLKFDEDFVSAKRSELARDQILEIKEEIDDYLEDVQYRVIARLDEQSLTRLQDYQRMEFPRLVDKLNQIAVEERIVQLINQV